MSLPTPASSPGGKFGLGVENARQGLALALLFSAAGAVLLALALMPPYAGDWWQNKLWTRTITLEGIHNAYNGTWPETYAIYPPVTLATYWVAGKVYAAVADPTFAVDAAQASDLLTYLLKLPSVVFHWLSGFVIFRVALTVRSFRTALAAAAVYLFNPAALFDLTYWGQPDAVYAFFLLVAVVGVAMGPLALGLAAMVAACFAKPQAWSLGPLLAVAGAVLYPVREWVRGVAAAAVVAALIIAPYALGDRLPQLMGLPSRMNNAAPTLSANAHNLWWLVSWGQGLHRVDSPPAIEGLHPRFSFRNTGYALWLGATALALAVIVRRRDRAAVFESAAFVAFAFVIVGTRIHENHAFMVLPLGALAAVHRPVLWPVWGLVSGVLLTNMVLHDPDIMGHITPPPGAVMWLGATLANAFLAVGLFLVWTVRLVLQLRASALDAAMPVRQEAAVVKS